MLWLAWDACVDLWFLAEAGGHGDGGMSRAGLDACVAAVGVATVVRGLLRLVFEAA